MNRNLTMRLRYMFKLAAIISYLLITLNGWFIGLPFCVWLAITLFDFGNIDQIFALIAVVGLVLIYINRLVCSHYFIGFL